MTPEQAETIQRGDIDPTLVERLRAECVHPQVNVRQALCGEAADALEAMAARVAELESKD